MRIAISGHRGFSAQVTRLIDQGLRHELAKHTPPLTGISCLADGADQLFARAVLDIGGDIEAVVPAAKYREGLPASALAEYDDLLSAASKVRELAYKESDPEAHMAASVAMLEDADLLVAVWDGQPARSYGGTADVVVVARERGIPVAVVWPEGATRD